MYWNLNFRNLDIILELSEEDIIRKLEPIYKLIEDTSKEEKVRQKDLIGFINIIIDLLDNYSLFPINKDDITIDNSKKIINGIDIYYDNGSHSIGNILQSYIYNLIDESVLEYCGYKMTHPLKKEMLLT